MNDRGRSFSAAVGGILTIAAVWLNFVSASSAGALWRDEANTVALATLPRAGDVWRNLQFDSFPVVWLTVVRVFSSIAGSGNDQAFRTLGFILGIALIAALWLNARTFGYRYPLIALALVAVAPSMIRWGDSMRAYGLGMLLIVLTMSAIWHYVKKPTGRGLLLAALASVLSVHTIYYNSVLLFAICAGAVAVCVRRRQFRIAVHVTGVGFVSAVSLAPYVRTIRGTGAWNSLVRISSYTLEWFSVKIFETLSPGGAWAFVLWVVLFLACLAISALVLANKVIHPPDDQKDNVLFGVVALLVGTVGSFFFLRELSYYTQPWYYLTLLLIAGLSMDIILGSAVTAYRPRAVLNIVSLMLGLATAIVAPAYLRARLTNVDTVASRLEAVAGPNDLIVVNPWYYGVSFSRYFRGSASWTTLPPITFPELHRYDLVMAATSVPASDAMKPILDDASRALAAGSTVFIVGTFPVSETRTLIPSVSFVAADESYQKQWGAELADFIKQHATATRAIVVKSALPISRYEKMTLTAVTGWRP